jgi:DNA-directed RNA polymerase subunit K/omega
MEDRRYTRYEKTRIISARALQIAQGSPILIDVPKSVTEPMEIAKLEWDAGVIPIDIKEESLERKTEKEEKE